MGRLTEALGRGGWAVDMRVDRIFMDTPRVRAAVDKVRRRNLSRIGHWIMQDARWSLRPARRKTLVEMSLKERRTYEKDVRVARARGRRRPRRPFRPSRAGHPPRVRPGSLLKRRLFFGWDFATSSVVIGPEKLSGRRDVPHALEHGGNVPTSRSVERETGLGSYYMEPRPLMGPALERAQDEMPKAWRDSVKG